MPRYKRDVSPVRPQQAKPRSRKRTAEKKEPAVVEEVQVGIEIPAAKRRSRVNADIGSSDNNEVETPDNVWTELYVEFGALFDPCPFLGKGVKPDYDALSNEFAWGQVNYVNPPFASEKRKANGRKAKSEIDLWLKRAYQECLQGHTTLLLIPGRTGNRYWDQHVFGKAAEIRFITGKILFKNEKKRMPHTISFVVFKPPSELEAERTNSKWFFGQQDTHTFPLGFVRNSELDHAYPQLGALLRTLAPMPVDWTGRDMALQWALRSMSVEELYHALENEEPDLMTLMPLFSQMILAQASLDRLEKSDPPDCTRKLPLPELLRRMAYTLYAERGAQLERWADEAGTKISKKVQSFFEAFFINAWHRYCLSRRLFLRRGSWDGEFEQQVHYSMRPKQQLKEHQQYHAARSQQSE